MSKPGPKLYLQDLSDWKLGQGSYNLCLGMLANYLLHSLPKTSMINLSISPEAESLQPPEKFENTRGTVGSSGVTVAK